MIKKDANLMDIDVIEANYLNPKHANEIVMLLDSYAKDPMGGGNGLVEDVKNNLVEKLSKLPNAFSLIVYVNKKPAGLANCFEGFSTFSCKPLVNIHDLAILPEFRGMKLGYKLLEKVEEIAISKGCCKVTLEVLSNNHAAKSLYQKFGFADYQLNQDSGVALFWEKKL